MIEKQHQAPNKGEIRRRRKSSSVYRFDIKRNIIFISSTFFLLLSARPYSLRLWKETLERGSRVYSLLTVVLWFPGIDAYDLDPWRDQTKIRSQTKLSTSPFTVHTRSEDTNPEQKDGWRITKSKKKLTGRVQILRERWQKKRGGGGKIRRIKSNEETRESKMEGKCETALCM